MFSLLRFFYRLHRRQLRFSSSSKLAFRPILFYRNQSNRYHARLYLFPSFTSHLVYILTLYKLVLKLFMAFYRRWWTEVIRLISILTYQTSLEIIHFGSFYEHPQYKMRNSAPSFFKRGYLLLRNGRWTDLNSIQTNAMDAT